MTDPERATTAAPVLVTVSADTYRSLINFPLPGGTISGSALIDGAIRFHINAALHHELSRIDADPERALRILLGLQPH